MASTVIDDAIANLYDQFYEYDVFGNLTQQFLVATGRAETYCYDNLHRLVGTDRFPSSVASQSCDGTYEVAYAYDAMGNILSKSDYANTYTYAGTGNAGPNAVTQVSLTAGGSSTFSYDGNGNLTAGSADGLSITYDAFNKPVQTSRNGAVADFRYGSNGNRFRQTGNKDVVYIDKLYERVNSSEHKAYLGDYAVYNVGGSDAGLQYLHKDRLGSMVAFSDDVGTLQTTATRHFDPFGKPREADLSDSTDPNNDLNGASLTSRGFTGHEHLNSVQLIHMNRSTPIY